MTENGISPAAARHIVQRVGETGQPPERNALAVNVGTEELLEVLREEYLLPIRELGRNSSFKLVQAPFGGGKTQFLHCLREVAWDLGFGTALVGVSPKECPFDDPVQIYREVARRLELPPGGPEEEPDPGIEVVLRQVAEARVAQHGEAAVRSWLREELSHARVDSHSFRRAAVLLMEAVLDGRDEREDDLAAFLRGERLGREEMSKLRLREPLEDTNAFRYLRSLVQVLRALDLPGVVLLFDEMDRVMSLTTKRKKAIGDNLRQMIDHCGQSTLPALLWVYAVPPEFMTNVVPEYPALEQRLKGASRLSRTSPLQPIIDLDRLSLSPSELFEKIGWRLLELYEIGYEHRFDRGLQGENVQALSLELGESQLETGSRRTFVKSVVHLLIDQHRGGERRLDAGDVRGMISRSGPELLPMDGEEDF